MRWRGGDCVMAAGRLLCELCTLGVTSTLVLAAGATPAYSAEVLAGRVTQVLERRGLGADALKIIDNLISHEGPPPPAAPAMVRELLKTPLAAVEVASLFDRAVPDTLRRLVETALIPRRQPHHGQPVPIGDLLTPYLNELAGAQGVLRSATIGNIDTPAILKTLDGGSPSAHALRGVMRAVDADMIARANAMFIDATARFVAVLRAAEGNLRFPDTAMRFESPIGAVVIGTRGDDAHGADAALIIDPDGNDSYARAPVAGGVVSVIVDLGGNDRYRGSDVVVHGLSAIVDFAGNDHYSIAGSGQGVAIAGASVILDFSGDDVYEAGFFAQGAAALGLGAIVDFDGNDSYRIRANGQGYGMAGGVGLLWDRAGNDSYTAAGLPDTFARGGGISAAQGAAYGYRTSLGGGIGILRDDAGDDNYTAEMFAQGMGYYYGMGILWDRGGNDRYRALRYAQGSGVHEAVGVLRDESGNDSYTATVGVAQGMGLDLAVGVLYDGAGDDIYRGDVLVQGAATANGIGILIDSGGADQWHAGAASGWGDADWERGMPTLALMLHDPAQASYTRADTPFMPVPESAGLGGPLAHVHLAASAPPVSTVVPGMAHSCPALAVQAPQDVLAFSEALSRVMSGLSGGKLDAAAYAQVQRQLTTRLAASIAEMPRDDFNALWTFGRALECAARDATAGEIEAIWGEIEHVLNADRTHPHPFAGPLIAVLRLRPPPAARMQPLLQQLARHPACSVRAGALRLMERSASESDTEASDQVARDAQAALGNPCWRLQTAARDVLRQLKAPFDEQVLPVFLRSKMPPATQ